MENVELELASLKRQVSASNEKYMQAKIEKASATQELEKLNADLLDKFKCSSVEQAHTLKEKIETTLEKWIADAKNALEDTK